MRIKKNFWLSCLLILFVSASFVETGVSESSSKVEIQEDSIVLKRIGPKRRFGGSPNGVLYSQANQSSKTVVIFIHPESDRRNDWHCIPLAKKGFAAFGFATRYVKEDRHLIMEEVLLDLAEAIRIRTAVGQLLVKGPRPRAEAILGDGSDQVVVKAQVHAG